MVAAKPSRGSRVLQQFSGRDSLGRRPPSLEANEKAYPCCAVHLRDPPWGRRRPHQCGRIESRLDMGQLECYIRPIKSWDDRPSSRYRLHAPGAAAAAVPDGSPRPAVGLGCRTVRDRFTPQRIRYTSRCAHSTRYAVFARAASSQRSAARSPRHRARSSAWSNSRCKTITSTSSRKRRTGTRSRAASAA